ncbi:hypothetical protein LSH36_169g04021 [Paralvinella palmiformis]|uniref:FUN14 domain-containing protein 1 n=1 Tax=Paralvinella palmiformis TaxID=53620 RepID=A0AAD9JT67_9ANNE|nr:hypothetical protein LSH36_169g04021 [Paralvinella palmiformis]
MWQLITCSDSFWVESYNVVCQGWLKASFLQLVVNKIAAKEGQFRTMSGEYQDRVVGYIERRTKRIKNGLEKQMDDEEEFEVLDLTDRAWFDKALRDLSKASVAKQITVGGVSGWCSGYLFGKVGKAAALALGGSLLLLQVASHQGYITINWGKLEKNINAAKRQLERSAKRRLPAVIEEVRDFAIENAFLAGGFAGGFLLGLAS